jgi:hypothetical protein
MTPTADFARQGTGATHRAAAYHTAETLDESDLEELERQEPLGRSYDEETDWGRVGSFGAGLALGVVLGAGVALLLAPQSGEETREMLGERARMLRGQAGDSWDDLRDELRWLSRRGRRKLRRGATRGRWMAEDIADRSRKRTGRV